MKRIKVLGSVLKRTRADKIIIGFIVFIFAIAAVIQLVEPDINRYGDALWYCYAVISTAGFGDVVAVTFIGKMCSVLLTIYSLFVVAIATGVVVNFYTQMVECSEKRHLPCLWISWKDFLSFPEKSWRIFPEKCASFGSCGSY